LAHAQDQVQRDSWAVFDQIQAEAVLLRFGLSYRDVEELLAQRGIEVDHVTIDRWVQRFTPRWLTLPGLPPRRR
jgi:transposase-like protein